MTYRNDNKERKRVSAVIDKELYNLLNGNKSAIIEEALEQYLKTNSNPEDQALLMKQRKDQILKQVEELQAKAKSIDNQAKETFGTKLEDYIEENNIATSSREKKIKDFVENNIINNNEQRKMWDEDYNRKEWNVKLQKNVWNTRALNDYGIGGADLRKFLEEAYEYYNKEMKE